jgi:hypothetical protein
MHDVTSLLNGQFELRIEDQLIDLYLWSVEIGEEARLLSHRSKWSRTSLSRNSQR